MPVSEMVRHNVLTGLLATSMAVALSAPVQAEQSETSQPTAEAPAPADSPEYTRLLTLAAAGNPVAQYNLGVLNDEGIDRPVNPLEARKWWVMAADNGNVQAQHALALLIIDTESLREVPDYADAIRWLQAAAKAGNDRSCYTLAKMYEYGLGVNRDWQAAAALFRQAAEKGLDRAQYALGKMYRDGRGVDQDATQAAHWFAMAAEQGMVRAQSHLATRLHKGEGVDKDPVKALKWAILAARKGHADAARTEAALRHSLSAAEIRVAEMAATNYTVKSPATDGSGS